MKLVYVIYSCLSQSIKIGYTSNLNQRFSQIQLATSEPLILLMTFEGGREVEKELHTLLYTYKLRGEWFKFDKIVKDLLLEYQKTIFYRLKLFNQVDHNINEETVNYVLSKALELIKSRANRLYITVPQLKQVIIKTDLSTKQIENILLDSGWEIVVSGKCKTKFFRPKNNTTGI